MKDAKQALRESRFDRAESLANQVQKANPLFFEAQLVAGEAAMRAGRVDSALDYYSNVPPTSSKGTLALFSKAELLRDLGRVSDAEQHYLSVLKQQPDNVATHERMAFLLGGTGRRWESLPHLMFLLKSGTSSFEELVLLGDLDRPLDQSEYLQKCARACPGDLQVRLGLAALAVTDQAPEAREQLEEIIRCHSELIAAQLLLGELLVSTDVDAFARWQAQLPKEADSYPQSWYIRGLWARHLGELRIAVRCFWEALRRDPTHRRSHFQLGQIFALLNEEIGQDFALRSRQFFELTQKLNDVLKSGGRDEPSVRQVTILMEETGRIWEACGWAARASQDFPVAGWARETATRLAGTLQDDLPRTIPSANLALRHDLSSYPDYGQLFTRKVATTQREVEQRSSAISFIEEDQSGLEFIYDNGADPATRGARMQEQTGGGVAVLDFDLDGYPDLFFPQGGEWKTGRSLPEPPGSKTDRLFRNLTGTSFVDVTASASPEDQGFGQGCSAGDFDNDGFIDLYVANIGRNQLLHNNGDGTFSDVTEAAGLSRTDWTTSCVIVDLNADGSPDLFDVNYVTGPDVYEALCNNRACSPRGFDGSPSQLLLSRGNGTFQLVEGATPQTGCKGMGVVAFDDRIPGRPSLFISNDQVPCFLLRNSPASNAQNIHLENEGFISGLAFNQDGLAMAAMGIAADDVDGNGLIDFYVTTFKDEAKILYLQHEIGFFVDATKTSGLGSPGFPFVGWGTQFLDADLDGWPDLVVANGHIDDYRDEGGEFHMRPQFFRNTGAARFVELNGAKAGDVFDRKRLGRGLSRLDWNRDGRMDFAVSNMNDRASLVTNQTKDVGNYLNVALRATSTARDAVGTNVEVMYGKKRYRKQLVAGDGFEASNERMLQFGLNNTTAVDEVHIFWPSGKSSVATNIPTDATLVLIEGNRHGILQQGETSGQVEVTVIDASH